MLFHPFKCILIFDIPLFDVCEKSSGEKFFLNMCVGRGEAGPVKWSPSYWSNSIMSRAGIGPCTEGEGTGVLYRLEARTLYRDEQTDTHNWHHYLPATSFIPHLTFWDSFRSLGSRCEIQINECEEIAPCQNEANCSDTDGDYQCNCTLGGYNLYYLELHFKLSYFFAYI